MKSRSRSGRIWEPLSRSCSDSGEADPYSARKLARRRRRSCSPARPRSCYRVVTGEMRMALRRGVSSSATVLSESREAAFDALFRAHYPALCRFAARLSGSSAVGEEIVQQVFADLWNRWASRVEPMPERAYLYKAVRHQILDL